MRSESLNREYKEESTEDLAIGETERRGETVQGI